VARVSGPGEGYSRHSLHPSPAAHLAMGGTLSLQERDFRLVLRQSTLLILDSANSKKNWHAR
jgi:hypothetical protein